MNLSGGERGVFTKPEYSPSVVERSSVIFFGVSLGAPASMPPHFIQSILAGTPQAGTGGAPRDFPELDDCDSAEASCKLGPASRLADFLTASKEIQKPK